MTSSFESKQEIERTEDVLVLDQNITFSSMHLKPELLRGFNDEGFIKPSPIQLQAIPRGKLGMDLICQSKSGTGKTLTFCSIILERIHLSTSGLSKQDLTPQAIIITPTREIAVQIRDFMRRIARYYKYLTIDTFIGGVPLSLDRKTLNLGCQVIIGTPGRVLQLINLNALITFNVKMIVFDEADQLFSAESFKLDVRSMLNKTPRHKQVMAFSAAYNEEKEIINEITSFMRSPEIILISNDRPSLKGVQQYFYYVDSPEFKSKSMKSFDDSANSKPVNQHNSNQHKLNDSNSSNDDHQKNLNEVALDRLRSDHRVLSLKVEALVYVLSSIPFNQCIVFLNNKGRARDIVAALNESGFPSYHIGGDQPQNERLLAISKLREFKIRILVSSDLTSRGIDCDRINLVINLDLPFDAETYLHRVGRTGRFGTYGLAITFVSRERKEMDLMANYVQSLNSTVHELPEDMKVIADRKYLNHSMVLKSEEERKRIQRFEKDRERVSIQKGADNGKLREPSSMVESEYIQKERERKLWEEATRKKEEEEEEREERKRNQKMKEKKTKRNEKISEVNDDDERLGDIANAVNGINVNRMESQYTSQQRGYTRNEQMQYSTYQGQQHYRPMYQQQYWSQYPQQPYYQQQTQATGYYNDLNQQALKAARCFHAMYG